MQLVLRRHPAPFLYVATAAVSLPLGLVVARAPRGALLLLFALAALGGLAFVLSVPAHVLFLGWLFVAPLFQDAAERTTLGAPLVWALYTAPAVYLAGLATFRRHPETRLSLVDVFPALYGAYALVAMVTTSDVLQTTPKFVFTTAFLGPLVYYYVRSGPGAGISRERIVSVLLWGASLQGALGIVNFTTGWNPWGDTLWQERNHAEFPRAVATLSNPAVLGTFLGIGIVLAVAVFSFQSPRSLRLPAYAALVVGVPGLAMTMTRGPVVATMVAVILVLLAGRLRFASMVAIASAVLVVVALLPTVRQTELYQGRLSDQRTVAVRAALQDLSLRLAAEKPILGWGYASFDEVKRESGFDVRGLNIHAVQEITSHNTYLTILVELGAVGLVFYALPFVVLSLMGLWRARAPTPQQWLLVGSLGALVVIALSAVTFDLRFFSFAQVLPFIFLAILRTSGKPASASAS